MVVLPGALPERPRVGAGPDHRVVVDVRLPCAASSGTARCDIGRQVIPGNTFAKVTARTDRRVTHSSWLLLGETYARKESGHRQPERHGGQLGARLPAGVVPAPVRAAVTGPREPGDAAMPSRVTSWRPCMSPGCPRGGSVIVGPRLPRMPTGTREPPAGFTRRAAYWPRSCRITSARSAALRPPRCRCRCWPPSWTAGGCWHTGAFGASGGVLRGGARLTPACPAG